MISDFNYFKQPEQPILVLCNPDDTELGLITNAEEVSLSIRFNDISEISYSIYQTDDNEYNETVYKKHIERRQVYVAGVGYFIITSVNESEDENGVYKSIQAKSCEYELNNIAAPYINGTYCLYKASNFEASSNEEIAQQEDEYLNENCILYEVMKVIPSWRLEQSLLATDDKRYQKLASEFRTFESTDTTVYSFFKNEIQQNYDCFVDFDIENRIIRVLHYDDVFQEEPVIISKANVLNSCEVSTTIDNYVNCLNVEGQDGVSIASCNPAGNSLIYNFDHDINIGLIDGVLKDALMYWKSNQVTSVNLEIQEDDRDNFWILLPEFINEWEKFNATLTQVKKWVLELADIYQKEDIGISITDFINNAYNDGYKDIPCIFDYLFERLSWYVEYGMDLDNLGDDIYHCICPNDDSDLDTYIKNVNKYFSITPYSARASYLYSLASGSYSYLSYLGDSYSSVLSLSDCSNILLTIQNAIQNVSSEVSSLNSYLEGYKAQLSSLNTTVVEKDANQEALKEQRDMLNNQISLVENSIATYEEIVENLNKSLDSIKNKVQNLYYSNRLEGSFVNYLNENPQINIEASDLYAKLTRYLKQQTFTNDTIVVTDAMSSKEKFIQERALYDEAVDLLNNISIPSYEVGIDTEAFIFSPDFKEILEKLSIKSAFYIELPSNDAPLFHLLEININYDERTCEFKMGNRLNISDPAAILSELQSTASSAASIVASERINWGINEEKVNQLMEAKNADIDTTFRIMKNSINNTSIGADGLRCYALDEDGNPTHGFWGANGVLMFTDGTDGSDPKMAVGRILKSDGSYEYGFYGQSIIANTITADKIMAGAVSKGTNYIKNGSFEAHNNHTPSNWVVTGSGQVAEVTGTPIGSRYLLSLGQSTVIQELENALNPGTYTLSFYCSDGKADVSICSGDTVFETCEYGSHIEEINHHGSLWYRCYKSFNIGELISNPTVKITCSANTKIDGVMLEKSHLINEYTPYLNEMFAKYTTIDDNGVTVYNGKIRILNNVGVAVFDADDNGNLVLTGTVTADDGMIGGWDISPTGISKTNSNGSLVLSSSDNETNIISYTRESDNVVTFSISKEGALSATDAIIKGNITADELIATTGGEIANWTINSDGLYGGSLTLSLNSYTLKLDGYGIYGGLNGRTGMSITMASGHNNSATWDGVLSNLFSDTTKTYDNLALSGRDCIYFGTRRNGTYEEAAKIYWNTGIFGDKPVFEIEAIKAERIVIGSTLYIMHAYTNTALISALNPTGRYLALTTLV